MWRARHGGRGAAAGAGGGLGVRSAPATRAGLHARPAPGHRVLWGHSPCHTGRACVCRPRAPCSPRACCASPRSHSASACACAAPAPARPPPHQRPAPGSGGRGARRGGGRDPAEARGTDRRPTPRNAWLGGGGAAVHSPAAARPLLPRAPPLSAPPVSQGFAGHGRQPRPERTGSVRRGAPWRKRRAKAAAATAAAAAAAAPRRRARPPRLPPPAAGSRAGRRPRAGSMEAGAAAAAAPARRRPARGARRRPAAAGGGSRCWKGRSANTRTSCRAGRAGKAPGRPPAALRGRVLAPGRPQDGARATGAAARLDPNPPRPPRPEARLHYPLCPLSFLLFDLFIFPAEFGIRAGGEVARRRVGAVSLGAAASGAGEG